MKDKWVLNRLFEERDQPIPRFAYQSTINWMASLAIICDSQQFSDENIKASYATVQRRKVNKKADTLVFENVLMALHNVASLNEMANCSSDKVAIVRAAIIAWYYAIYYSSSAMIAASSGSKQETHTGTAKVWQSDIVDKNLALGSFGLSLKTLVKNKVKLEIDSLRKGRDFALVNTPSSPDEAWGAIFGYLGGTADYEKWKVEERVRGSKEFLTQGFSDFRKKAARELRDSKLEGGLVNFLIQSFRYRGKANYRDSIYLSYGSNNVETITTFIEDLDFVAETFLRMACHYSSKRVEKGMWNKFSQDLDRNLNIKVNSHIYNF